MSGDRLARIKGWFTGTYAHYLTGEESEAVLALVEIAEAARECVDAEQADDLALANLLSIHADPNREEEMRNRQKGTRLQADAKFDALRSALNRLDGQEVGSSTNGVTNVLALVEIAERAGPMARLPIPLSADERQQWLIRQNELRDALARLDSGAAEEKP